jgi:hypothetical protein
MTKVRFRTCLRNTIYDALRNRPGWTETDSDSDFDFIWADVPWMREHFDGFSPASRALPPSCRAVQPNDRARAPGCAWRSSSG